MFRVKKALAGMNKENVLSYKQVPDTFRGACLKASGLRELGFGRLYGRVWNVTSSLLWPKRFTADTRQ